MKSTIRFGPAFATLFISMKAGDSIIAESGAMASMSANVDIKTRFNGGFFNAILRKVFGGESLFINSFHSNSDAEVVLTQTTPGEISEIELQGTTLCLQPGAFIACDPTVRLQLAWAGFASWFGGEGLFRLKLSGHGRIWLGGYGAIFEKEIQSEYSVDTGHLIAYEPTLSLSVGLSGGIFSSFFGGEGFVTRVRGRGKCLMQTRSMDGLAAWTNQHI